jgi:hypothetical protein
MDTNVAIVANGRSPQAGDHCVNTCIKTLLALRERQRLLLLDDLGLILEEYRRYLSPSGQPGSGDAFFKWLWDNQGNPKYCRQVRITPMDDPRRFEEFPDDGELARFDPSDRKFVAVAIASLENPPILNAADNDWWDYREALRRHGVEIRFLCPELMGGGR